MTERERLIELMEEAHESWLRYVDECAFNQTAISFTFEQMFADHLLSNGVIVPPCKVGDMTYLLLEKLTGGYDVVESKCVAISTNSFQTIYSMYIGCPEIHNTLEFNYFDFGRWVFLTREEAEAKLKERRDGE